MEKKRSKLTKMLKKTKRIESDNEEVEKYLFILEEQEYLCVFIPGIDDEIELYRQSWNNIFRKTNENIGKFIGHVLFFIQIKANKSDISEYKSIKKGDKESKQIFFESIFNTSKPLDVPSDMTLKDFEKFQKFLNKK